MCDFKAFDHEEEECLLKSKGSRHVLLKLGLLDHITSLPQILESGGMCWAMAFQREEPGLRGEILTS